MALDPNIDWANKLTDHATAEDWDRVLEEIDALPADEHTSAMLGLVKLRAGDLERVKKVYREAFTIGEGGVCPHCGGLIGEQLD